MQMLGTENGDTINAGDLNDTLLGLAGDDFLSSAFSESQLFGGLGDDTLSSDYTHVTGRSFYSNYDNTLLGGSGEDIININLDIQENSIPQIYGIPSFENLIEGGAGNDTISVDQYVSLYDYNRVDLTSYQINLGNTISDFEGDNTVGLDYGVYTNDIDIVGKTAVLLGNGNDSVTFHGGADANNWLPVSEHRYSLGDGLNNLTVSEVTGILDMLVTSGADRDNIDIFFGGEEGNDMPVFANFHIEVGGDDDQVELVTRLYGSNDGGTLSGFVDLGKGNNSLTIDSELGGAYTVIAGNGNDTLLVSTGDGDIYNSDQTSTFVNAGDGDNIVAVNETSYDFGGGVEFHVSSGSGDDSITILGSDLNTVDTGDGNDTIVIGSGNGSVAAGLGADQIIIDQSVFNANPFDPVDTMTIIGFDLAQSDQLKLIGFDLPGLVDAGAISKLVDFEELATPEGDILSLSQVGMDLVLTLNLGADKTGVIKFEDFQLPEDAGWDGRNQISSYERSMIGTADRDRLSGNDTDEWIEGLGDNDAIFGGHGHDYIAAGSGNDYYVFGNEGSDIFEFGLEDDDIKIHDFADGEDFILLTDGLEFADLHIKTFNIAGTVTTQLISDHGDRLILLNVVPDEIGVEDFWS